MDQCLNVDKGDGIKGTVCDIFMYSTRRVLLYMLCFIAIYNHSLTIFLSPILITLPIDPWGKYDFWLVTIIASLRCVKISLPRTTLVLTNKTGFMLWINEYPKLSTTFNSVKTIRSRVRSNTSAFTSIITSLMKLMLEKNGGISLLLWIG